MKLIPSKSWRQGHVVTCIDAYQSDLIFDAMYEVLDTNPQLDAVKLVEYPDRWFICSRFKCYAEEPVTTSSVGTGMKFDGDKPRMDLLFDGCPNALEAVGQVLTFGAKKYAAHSWQSVEGGAERYKAALIRHLLAVGKGEDVDPESGLSHLAHLACNALFILELEKRNAKSN